MSDQQPDRVLYDPVELETIELLEKAVVALQQVVEGMRQVAGQQQATVRQLGEVAKMLAQPRVTTMQGRDGTILKAYSAPGQ